MEDQHPKKTRTIPDELIRLVAEIRQGDMTAEEEVLKWSMNYVNRFQRTPENPADIVHQALAETLETNRNNPRLSDEIVSQFHLRNLDKYKRRLQRQHAKERRFLADETLAVAASAEEKIVALETLRAVVETIYLVMERVLPDLKSRDYELIIRRYSLTTFFPSKVDAPTFEKENSKRRAVLRARRRLNILLEAALQEESESVGSEGDIIRYALEIIRGERVIEVVELLQELEDD